jgi:hypothetical protein
MTSPFVTKCFHLNAHIVEHFPVLFLDMRALSPEWLGAVEGSRVLNPLSFL